jgi:predicted transposase/invertase (TIGR01784 family)
VITKTKFDQQALAEGEQKAKLEIIPSLRKEGFNLEKIAQLLNLPLNIVKKSLEENEKRD